MSDITNPPSHLCPNCKSPMVHSAVGYMCPECGTLVRHSEPTIHSADEGQTLSTQNIQHTKTNQQVAAEESVLHIEPEQHQVTHPTNTSKAPNDRFHRRLRARLKRLVVPELPSQFSEPELPSALSTNALPTQDATAKPEVHSDLPMQAKDSQMNRRPMRSTTMSAELHHATPDLDVTDFTPSQPTNVSNDDKATPEEEQVASSHTRAFELAEAIAEQDMSSDQETKIGQPEPEVLPDITNTTPAPKAAQDNAKQADQSQKKQPSQTVLYISTLLAFIFVGTAGYWFVNRPKPAESPQPQQTAPAAQNTSNVAADVLKRDQTRKDDLNSISAALEVYKQQQGTYPVGDDIKVVYPLQYTTPPYISYVNYDPSSTDTEKIKYAYKSDGETFTIAAKLENAGDPDAQDGYYIVRSK